LIAEGVGPRRALRSAILRRPCGVLAEENGDDEAGVPEHLQGGVQRGKNRFAENAEAKARKSAVGAAAFAVEGSVGEGKETGNEEDGHANPENEHGVLGRGVVEVGHPTVNGNAGAHIQK